ncbi:hypothetical protein Psuf_006890 [Phytohabitans suffuscus]|uniref:Uncharacterized protein n=1 Tax=Phytohabitans suffuscus TaxID=624315 RepID=A0A6F8YBA6_9ACTN|nr:hypothetical protein Psuf_006890 [Phytohabitans suffuscus]
MEARAWYADIRQRNEVAISGERLLRLPGWALRRHPDEVLADLRAALCAAGSVDRGTDPPLWGQFHTTICCREPRVRGRRRIRPGLLSSSG